MSNTHRAAHRRDRAPDPGAETLEQALAQKLLHFWLQNRQQTLMPLAINLRRMEPEARHLFAAALPSLLLVARPRAEADADAQPLRAWLEAHGADPQALETFDAALEAPLALSRLIDRAIALDTAVPLLVAALLCTDPRAPASALLCDLLQARLDLPPALVRSAWRRFGPNGSARVGTRVGDHPKPAL